MTTSYHYKKIKNAAKRLKAKNAARNSKRVRFDAATIIDMRKHLKNSFKVDAEKYSDAQVDRWYIFCKSLADEHKEKGNFEKTLHKALKVYI